MQVSKINQVSNYRQAFKAKEDSNYENPISRKTERNLTVWTSLGGSALLGVIAGSLSTVFFPVAEGAKRTLKTSAWPIAIGAAVAGITMAFTLPSKVYNTKVNAFVKEKEMDVFSRDRDLKANLTEEVHNEVKDPEVSLDKKLDDNLKLQMANKGTALGIANISAQA